MFDTVLVANRGEIAVRVIRTLRRLGIRSVAVYSDPDVDARHVLEADAAVRLGPAPARESYLDIGKVLDAAARTGAQAIHPGYGFLAENADFAAACERARVVFLGPPARAIEVMGDKIAAKNAVAAFDVPVVPGVARAGLTDDALVTAAAEVGYPVLIKPSAGGGGKGMRLVQDPARLPEALVSARREAMSSFGDDTLFLERFVLRPRHIEVQVLADAHGNVVHLGERECSLQRRHQKVIEEAPSPLLDPQTRERIGVAACNTARCVDYVGAGTVEFIVSRAAPRRVLFHGDEYPAAGGTPGHRGDYWIGPGRVAVAGGCGRKVGLRPKRHRAAWARDRGSGVCGGSRAGIPAHRRPGAGGVRTRRPRGAGGFVTARRHGGRQ